ncbi:hypothetical protein HDV63DRAFT_63543 [Trichoderma sp. SZMC 28014]
MELPLPWPPPLPLLFLIFSPSIQIAKSWLLGPRPPTALCRRSCSPDSRCEKSTAGVALARMEPYRRRRYVCFRYSRLT